MICFRCRNEEFETRHDPSVEQVFRGETFHVAGAVEACQNCGWRAVTDAQADQIVRRTVDAYRRKHGLLTEEEIRACRKRLGMSQVAFAQFIGVSPVTVKRWETGQIQEPIYDRMIRDRCRDIARAGAIKQWLVKTSGLKALSTGIVVHGIAAGSVPGTVSWSPRAGRPGRNRFAPHVNDDSDLALAA